jgi:hypothetical protein
MAQEHRRSPVAAFLVQEHNLPASRAVWARAFARARHRILWLSRHRPDADTSGKGHGTAIAIPYDQIELKPDESLHQAVERLLKSLTGTKDGRITCATTLLEGKQLRLVSAYAPTGQAAGERPSFFSDKLASFLTRRTILAIDANCVPDVVLDTRRPSDTNPYDNRGASELATLIADKQLVDVAREQLGLTVDLTPLPYDSPTVTLTSAFAAALADAKSKADA